MPLINDSDSDSEDHEMSIDQAFKKVGGLGKFHTLMFVILSAFLITGEIYNSLIIYFNKTPELICTDANGSKTPCDWETACTSND